MPLCLFSTILYLHFFLIFIYLYRNAILYLRYSMQGFLRWLTHTTMNILFGQGKRRWRDFFFGSAFDRYHGHGDKGNLAQRSQEMKRTYNFAVCSTVNRYVQNEEQDTWVNKYSMQINKKKKKNSMLYHGPFDELWLPLGDRYLFLFYFLKIK